MIIFNKQKYEGNFQQDYIGIVGENLVSTVEFTVKNFYCDSNACSIHLRFADGSVNSVAPQTVERIDNGTYIVWQIGKNDIFCHGCVELQLELRNGESVLQTEIIRMFAGESLPVEDREYTNPNSETLALRDEVKRLFDKTAEQNTKIENNVKIIEKSDLDRKADKATTLVGYGITDAYTMTQTDKYIKNKLDKMPFDTTLSLNSPNYVTSGTVYNAMQSKADKTSFEQGKGNLNCIDDAAKSVIKSASFNYVKNNNAVMITFNISFNAGIIPQGGFVRFSGLPFKIQNGGQLFMPVADNKNKEYYCKLYGTCISFTSVGSANVVEDESLVFSAVYIM